MSYDDRQNDRTTDIQTAVDIIKCGVSLTRSGSPQQTAVDIKCGARLAQITSECETFGGESELLAAVHSVQQAVC